jgi:hypothetical protein
MNVNKYRVYAEKKRGNRQRVNLVIEARTSQDACAYLRFIASVHPYWWYEVPRAVPTDYAIDYKAISE